MQCLWHTFSPPLRRGALRHALHRCRFSSDLPYNVIDGSMHLRVPSGAVTGTPSDVALHLPLLHELSVGARRGTPRWVDKAAAEPAAGKKRSESWLEITYPFSTDAELREQYMLGDGLSLRAGRFLEELDAFSADCALRHARVGDHPISVVTAAHDGLSIFEGLSAVRGVVPLLHRPSRCMHASAHHGARPLHRCTTSGCAAWSRQSAPRAWRCRRTYCRWSRTARAR